MLSIIAAMTASAVGPGIPYATEPKPVGMDSLASIITANDYPPDSANRGEQGSVTVVVHVDAAGGVSGCDIKSSSGFPALDAQTCAVITARARFTPAHDAKGRAVPADVPQTVAWRLEVDVAPNNAWDMRITSTFGPDGAPTSCRIDIEGMEPSQSRYCPPAGMKAMTFPNLPPGMTGMTWVKAFAPGPAAPPRLGTGDILAGRIVAAVTIDASGHISSCKTIETEGTAPPEDPCQDPVASAFDPRLDPDGKAVPFEATFATTMYVHGEGPAWKKWMKSHSP